jgi:SAM-dependent methyltransferase
MTENRLSEHYNTKYAAERGETRVTALPLAQPYPANRFEAALACLPDRLPEGADVLELGAGNGLVAESMRAGGVPFGSYTIGDISDARLSGLRRNFTDERFRFVRADAEKPRITVEGKFDAVVMVALIEHLVDPIRAMADIHGLLKPGGFVYVDTPNIAKWTRRIKLALGKFPSTAAQNEGLTTFAGEDVDLHDEGHLHYFTYRSLDLILTQRCGFSRTVASGYFAGPAFLGPKLGNRLAQRRPTVFSEIATFAYA